MSGQILVRKKSDRSRDRNTQGRQSQERLRAARGRGQLWVPGGTYDDGGQAPVKILRLSREQTLTWL